MFSFRNAIYHYRKMLVLFFVTGGLHLNAQDKIDSAMTTLSEKYPQEKIYIAYNKNQYVAGESIWIKGFIFSGYNMSDISTNLYVEIFDSNKGLICRKAFPAFNGVTEGSFLLADSLPEGVYYIRAYTSWMLNFSEDFQYLHPLLVYNPNSRLQLRADKTTWNAGAFAEGGSLISGILTNIAIRLSSVGELPEHWSGYLYDKLNPSEKIASFASLDKNVALTRFVPQAGKEYSLMINDNEGYSTTIPVPAILKQGISLSVNQQDENLEYSINFVDMPVNETYKIVGTVNNDIVYKGTLKNDALNFTRTFSTAELPRGVLRLTLFNINYQVVAERLCFLSPQVESKPTLDSVIIDTKARSLNQFNMHLDSGKTYSVFVYDEKLKHLFTENNIVSACWLTTDFTDDITDAANYFTTKDTKNKVNLDVLLMTERWKRFKWEEVLEGRFPTIKYPKDNYLSYMATVQYKNKNLANEIFNLVIFLPDSTRQILQAKTDQDGKFLIEGLIFEDSASISFKAANRKLSADNLQVLYTPIDIFNKYELPLPKINYLIIPNVNKDGVSDEVIRTIGNLKNEQLTKHEINTLKEVVVKTKTKSPKQLLDEKLSTGRMYNPRETIYDFVNEKQNGINGNNLLNWLKGRVPGGLETATYFVDEYKVEKDMVNLTSFDEVAMIKIQGRGASHQILIYLRKGDEMKSTLKPLSFSIIKGYARERNFIMPDFSISEYGNWKSDKRDLLFWGNSFTADVQNQQLKIKFYNNDNAQKFRLVVVSVSAEGAPIYYEEILQ